MLFSNQILLKKRISEANSFSVIVFVCVLLLLTLHFLDAMLQDATYPPALGKDRVLKARPCLRTPDQWWFIGM